MTGADTAGAAAGHAYILLGAGLLFDAALIVAIFLARVKLLRVTAKTLSHGLATPEWRPYFYATAILCAAYFVANPTLQTTNILRPYFVMVLVGILVCKRACWIGIDHAVFCSLIFCILSIFIGDYTRRGIDKLYPDRPTVNRSVASLIDANATHGTNGSPLEPSEDILTALVRTTSTTTSGIMGEVLGFLRTGIELKAQMDQLSKRASREAALANLLAGVGTNVGSRMSEKGSMNELMGGATGPSVPFARLVPEDTNGPQHGYLATYADAKRQIAEVNRIASNNAAIVNELSGIGTNVGDRKEEMDKLYAALLDEAKRGGVDLSSSGPPITEDQIASLSKAMNGGSESDEGGGTNAAPAEKLSIAAVQKALDSVRNAAAVYSASANLLSGVGTNARDHAVTMDKLHATLLQEAMKGNIDLSTNGAPMTEKEVARVRDATGRSGEPAPGGNAVGAAATPAEPPSPAAIQAALNDIRRAVDAYAASVKRSSDVHARARALAADMAQSDELLLWSGAAELRAWKPEPALRLMRFNMLDRWRRYYRAPWEGAQLAVSASIAEAQIAPAAKAEDLAAPKSEIVIVQSKPTQKNKPPPPSAYELLSQEERAKWDAALRSIKVSGVVGSSVDAAAIVNGKLVRRGEIFVVDSAGSQYSFRLTGVSRKGNCGWEPVVKPKQGPATLTVRF